MVTKHVHANLIKAWADGAEIEYFDSYEKRWLPPSGGPAWSPDRKYRIKDPYQKLKEAAVDTTKQIRLIDRSEHSKNAFGVIMGTTGGGCTHQKNMKSATSRNPR